MQRNSSDRVLELDALRGLAAFAVLLFHYTTHYTYRYSPSYPTAFHFPLGMYGVELFFIISGFVIFMTLEKTEKPMDFVVSRFSRLFPGYWVSIVLNFITVKIFLLKVPAWCNPTARDALVNLTMLQEWFGAKQVAGVYWTLTLELSFYCLIFGVFILRKLKYIEALGALWLFLMVLNYQYLWRVHLHAPQILVVSKLLLFGHLFFAGILFYKLKVQGNTWYRHVFIGLCLVIHFMLRNEMRDTPDSFICTAIFFFIFYLFSFNLLEWIVQKPLVYLGTVSYSLYLIHENIGYLIINRLYAMHANPWVCFFVPMVCALLIATIITYGVEKPAMKYIRREYKHWKQKNIEQKILTIS
jgi:peptidoglycan/LPS O-acetylase OafA/YrhL